MITERPGRTRAATEAAIAMKPTVTLRALTQSDFCIFLDKSDQQLMVPLFLGFNTYVFFVTFCDTLRTLIFRFSTGFECCFALEQGCRVCVAALSGRRVVFVLCRVTVSERASELTTDFIRRAQRLSFVTETSLFRPI